MASKATLSIGGLPLVLTGEKGVEVAMSLPGMSVFRTATVADSPLFVHLDASVEMPSCRWLHRFAIADGAAECRFGVDVDGVYYFSFGEWGQMRFDPCDDHTVMLSRIESPSLLLFALWTAYAMLALPRRATPIHSSVVVHGGRAVLCLGESGTGKSTHTSLWIKYIDDCFLLNDDSPILRVEGDEVVAYGSPWSGKTPCFKQQRVPVAALLRLEQRPENTICRLGTIEAFTAVHPSCPPALAHEERCVDQMVPFIGQVIGHVPVYRLGCLPDADAARLSCSTIFGQS